MLTLIPALPYQFGTGWQLLKPTWSKGQTSQKQYVNGNKIHAQRRQIQPGGPREGRMNKLTFIRHQEVDAGKLASLISQTLLLLQLRFRAEGRPSCKTSPNSVGED